ncbi:MAG: sigma-70 family RNA polymerase sigma factor [Synechococcales bacterium]|nr:sigma-70 family RNA polymerase sigma factor [Synechococcales bacterium]
MKIPSFPESHHPLVKELFHHSDQDLLTLFQRHPEAGRYFVAIFCRYSPIVYTLIGHSARSPVQADYLFAITWRHIYHELRGVDLREFIAPKPSVHSDEAAPPLTLQNWIINITAVCINRAQLPPVEAIHYSLAGASPPLWCYVEQGLSQIAPTQRLVLVLKQTFHWSDSRIAAYLQAEGEPATPSQVQHLLEVGRRSLEVTLPEDIRAIYLNGDDGSSVTLPASDALMGDDDLDKIEGDLDEDLVALEELKELTDAGLLPSESSGTP